MHPILLLLGLLAAPAEPPTSDGEPRLPELPAAEEITVTGSRAALARPLPDAVELLQSLCFDPARLTGRFARPAAGSHWIELDEEERRQFRLSDPAAPAFGLKDRGRGELLWLKLEQLAQPGELIERRCTLLVLGGRDHRRFIGDMSKLFRSAPTQRHVGQQAGTPVIQGWQQWLWTGMPRRGGKDWRGIDAARGEPPTWIVVTDAAAFYREYDYIMGDVKTRSGTGPPVTMITFSVTSAPR